MGNPYDVFQWYCVSDCADLDNITFVMLPGQMCVLMSYTDMLEIAQIS